MQAEFESCGYQCIVPSLAPNDGSKGLEPLALQLKQVLDETLGLQHSLVCLVGFSMGGLICRYYLQQLQGFRRITLFFAIAAPHRGTYTAYFSNCLGARQMRPNSGFIQSLEASEACLQPVDCYSFWTPFDLMILPAFNSKWATTKNIKVMSPCHPMMVTNKTITNTILSIAEQRFAARGNRDGV